MSIALSILPLALTILCGYVLVRTGAVPKEQWSGIEGLSFHLLIPVMLINAIAFSDLSSVQSGPVIIALLLTVAFTCATVFTLRLFWSKSTLPDPSFTTIFQTSTRWNAFISLAAAELFAGPQAIALLAIAMALIVPLNNVLNIAVMVLYGTAKATPLSIAVMVVKNPIVQGCLIGVAINLSGITLPVFVVQTLDLIGRAALGVGILAVGAGIRFKRLFKSTPQMWAGVSIRLFVSPAIYVILAGLFGLGQTETIAGALVFAVPAATNGYIVAKKMGGDADLYVDILAWQTVLTIVYLPVLMAVMIR